MNQKNLWQTESIFQKLLLLEANCEQAHHGRLEAPPLRIARDITVVGVKELPEKVGFSKVEGQARMLHDLASIELQAMELGLRTLSEYPETPESFKQQLTQIIFDEAKHLKLCLDGIEQLGFKWGDWPTHTALWDCVSDEDSLIDRLLIVHRYLEGSGIDAGDTLLRRLSSLKSSQANKVVKVIAEEEIGHVSFGSDWFRHFCRQDKLDPNDEFVTRMQRLYHRLPKRLEKVNRELRIQAGFNDIEIECLIKRREELLGHHKAMSQK